MITPELRAQAKLAVKDEYTFDFLELGEAHSERELERALLARIGDFLSAHSRIRGRIGGDVSGGLLAGSNRWTGQLSVRWDLSVTETSVQEPT
jgi:hypothetical protein